MAEFRWILLGLGLLLMAGIWWWAGRRSGQAPGLAELRETSAKEALRQEALRQEAAARDAASPLSMSDPLHGQEWERSPFEPLSIKTSDHEQLQVLDEPMMVAVDEPHIPDDADTVPNADTGPMMPPVLTKVVPSAAKLPVQPVEPPAPAIDTSGRIAVAPGKPNTSEKQKIITVRVCAADETRWPGSALLSAFESQGLAYGRYQVFHRRHIDGRSLFSVASLVEPGTFDVAQMQDQQFKGVTLFAVLPGPVDPLLTVDDMLAAARGLASDLSGSVQDAKGVVLSPQRMAALRDDIARFQSSLAVS